MKRKCQSSFNLDEEIPAKENEFKNWIDDGRFDKIDNQCKNTISVRWDVFEKVKDDVIMIKPVL